MKVKGIATAVMSAALALCCFLAAGCGSPSPELEGAEGLTCSETYDGALSDKSYQTPDAAISAYISDEINSSASVTDSRKLRDLSQDEISALPLTAELKNLLTAAEEYTVTYSQPAATFDAAAGGSSRNVLLLTTGGGVYYLDPLPATGQELSKSYFKSACGLDNYRNCTMTMTENVTATVDNVSSTSTVVMTMKIADGKCLMEMSYNIPGETPYEAYICMEDGANGFNAYISEDISSGWTQIDTPIDLGNGEIIDDFDDVLVVCDYDYSELQKTDTGFTIRQEYFSDVVNQTIAAIAVGYDDVSVTSSDIFFYVAGGTLVRTYVNIAFDCSMSYLGESYACNINSEAVLNVTDFGTTVVEVTL